MDRTQSLRAALGALLLASAASACALRAAPGDAPAAPRAPRALASSDTTSDDAGRVPVTEVREYHGSPSVVVVGYEAGDSRIGLRATLTRDGELVREHILYVSTYAVPARTAWQHAGTEDRALRVARYMRDSDPCRGVKCLPPESFGAAIPDEYLRRDRDSLMVTFSAHAADDAVYAALPKRLITAYVAAVDSASAALRARRTATQR